MGMYGSEGCWHTIVQRTILYSVRYSLPYFTLHLFRHFEVQLSSLEELVYENSRPGNLPLTCIDVASHRLNCDSHQGIPIEEEYSCEMQIETQQE